MSGITVHPRTLRWHPELSSGDVVAMMRSAFRYEQRPSGEWVAIGSGGNSRLVEVVYLYNAERDLFFVYHAMTPPSRKTLLELDLEGRQQ